MALSYSSGGYKTTTPFANPPTYGSSVSSNQSSLALAQQQATQRAAELARQEQQRAEQQRQAEALRRQQEQQRQEQMLLKQRQDEMAAQALESQRQTALLQAEADQRAAYQANQEKLAAEAAAAEALRIRDEESARLAAEKVRQQAEVATAQEGVIKAGKEAEAAGITTERISKAVLYRNQQLQNQAQQPAQVVTNARARNKTEINRPGVSSTRINTGLSIGGYGGTKAGRVNPTGLNI
jgi:fused signal recognition particle receptor